MEKNNGKYVRDIDLILISNNGDNYLKDLFKDYDFLYNSFGGFKVYTKKFNVDIWEIGKTWAFKEGLLKEKVENIPKSVFLSIDAIAYDFETSVLYSDLYKKTIKENLLDVVLVENPKYELNFLRAIIFSERYSLEFSENLILAFKRNLLGDFQNSFDQILKEQEKHYGKKIVSKNQLIKYFEKLLF